MRIFFVALVIFSTFFTTSFASNVSSHTFDGNHLSMLYTIPFIGLIASVALLPLIAPKLWLNHYGKITLGWSIIFFIPLILNFGWGVGGAVLVDTLISEYIPFILLLLTLYVVSSGIQITGHFAPSPALNVMILLIGTLLASIMGTTGASMLLIRPILQANQDRRHKVHVVIFFIFLVANIGGGLTPLGDPPLFLGFLEGVSFFWTLQYMLLPVIITSSMLLMLFYLIDTKLFALEEIKPQKLKDNHFVINGKFNFILIAAVLAGIIISGFWNPNIQLEVFHSTIALENVFRDALFLLVIYLSFKFTPKQLRIDNQFNWAPILEVAKLFLGIFLTITPVILILQSPDHPVTAFLMRFAHDESGAPNNVTYFWITATLSAFLDNAPTYLVFFKMAIGDHAQGAAYLMNVIPTTLLTISMATVFTGPLTYIANAPNFMIKSIAEQQGIRMPSFFSYMLIAIGTLLPIYILLNVIFLM
ncbi:sodium:proton antiporter [Wohlfahrtiimonas chitiniclastica]|uniref:Sodium:proton antiporter n=1 Tax=Wohlfahrtiimonas chitiniclastica TaxID=400946 RepID=A0AB35BXC0_9GAMM|nr:sodium:proton antiporter [Wohlfahrtiimonas chitiniclastica]MBS7816228.1 sodium:proton antiporter [Wohlfahrtiimonas chitiniclastica]MBS7821777.1 sodium:proton antiporter [Wohlfahrtiimonas chitiniclastica]MBS7823865.1 sodium:proton antiporter [Wohlfahrtiimonas chitiniclastica]MBS7829569.1 sodium:proton antiporter [Wohlfahrtiimonas chitiniclastica]MBS7831536.1 sodium:proton antiporter [Wohlfahrtiimonas chitiniclastica]